MELQGYRSHGEPFGEAITFPRSGDPPAVAAAAVGPGANGDAAVHGGVAANSLPEGTDLWALVVGDEGCIASGVAEGLEQLQEQPGRLASARLKALAELQAVLRSQSNGVAWDAPITVPVGDLVLVVQLAMERLR
ncbi:hypothetical protein [Synechococcus sp. LA31]|uniref:hypothetical protein n=1 Tax=Synechococcus sp. LA31 TaxID=2741953 RepID=UPI001BDD25B4|nr:hypothetical protein [Synechococcus sp. LA31]QVV66763.1 hypothetical protein KJJ24_09730 [Synechococcus sp. LA31]